jgi:polysaccharide biosynthesis/export protein
MNAVPIATAMHSRNSSQVDAEVSACRVRDPIASRLSTVLLICILFVALYPTRLFGQAAAPSTTAGNLGSQSPNSLQPAQQRTIDERAVFAMATADYPVTPGDVYQLTYVYSSQPVAVSAPVDSEYRVNLSLFGTVDARGLTLPQLRKQVEQMVLKVSPGSGPQLSVQSIGLFQVYVKGEVTTAGWVPAWGLSRLSSIVADRLTAYSSRRDVEIVSIDGHGNQYDLFLASRFGRRELDPYVGPKDTVVVHRRAREVKIAGEVERPGTYQLLDGEDLETLLESYGGGFTKLADETRIQINRWDPQKEGAATTFYADATTQPAHVELRDLDTVHVSSLKQRLPVVFFEGALAPADGQTTTSGESFDRIRYPFAEGEMLSSAAAAVYDKLGTGSDIEEAFVVRDGTGEKIPVNLRHLVQDYDPTRDIPLRPFDRIVIPYRKYVVTVSGAVARPGQYPYVPDRTWHYYVGLAGGFDPAKHVGEDLSVTDADDKGKPESRFIEPDDKIVVPTNNPVFFTTPVVQAVGVLASVTIAVVTFLQLIHH